MANEPRHLYISGKRFNFAIGTNPEPWVREPSEQKLENTVTNSLYKIKRVLYLIDTAEYMSLGTSHSSSTCDTRPKSENIRQTSDCKAVLRFSSQLKLKIKSLDLNDNIR